MKIRIGWGMVGVAMLGGGAGARAAMGRYLVRELTPAGEARITFPTGLNNLGQVIGGASVGGWSEFDGTHVVPIPVVNGSEPNAINDSGVIVGQAVRGGVDGTGYIYDPAVGATYVNLPGSSATFFSGINNSSVVAGTVNYGPGPRPVSKGFVYDHGAVTYFPDLGGGYGEAAAINERGQVAGTGKTADGMYPATLFDSGQLITLGVPAGFTSAQPRAMNNTGMIVGEASDLPVFDPVAGVSSLFIYQNGQFTVLPSLGGRIIPLGVSDAGTAVGIYHYRDNLPGAFVYQDGELADLNTLIDPGSGWVLDDAAAINNNGEIIGQGMFNGQYTTFVLTPIPEPVGMGVGVVGIVVVRRRGRGRK